MATFPVRGQQAPMYWDAQLKAYIDEGDDVPGPPGPPPTMVAGAASSVAGGPASITITPVAGPPGVYQVDIGAPYVTLAAGTVTTGAAGSSASVSFSGSALAKTINFTIPRGDTGLTGPAPNLTMGTTTQVTPGSPGTASVSGTNPNYQIDIGIPIANWSVAGTNTVAPATPASVTLGGTALNPALTFNIPKGDTGLTGPAPTLTAGAATSVPGGPASVTVTSTGPGAYSIGVGVPLATWSVAGTSTLAPGASATVTVGGTDFAPTLTFGIPQGAVGPLPNQSATSTTSNLIGIGSKTFALSPAMNAAFPVGITVKAQGAAAANYMVGVVTASSTTSVTINVTETGGSGTFASWTLVLGSYRGLDGSLTGPGASVSGNLAAWTNTAGTTLGDSGVAMTNLMLLSGIQTASGQKTFTSGVILGGGGALQSMPDGALSTFTPSSGVSVASGKAGFEVIVNDGSRNRRMGMFVNDTDGVWGLSATYGTGGAMPFVINYTGGTTGEWFRIDTGGKVGISQPNPTAQLHVVPTVNSTTVATIQGRGVTTTINNKALTSNVATLGTTANHGYSVGRQVIVSGVDATFNGTYTITAIPDSTHFSYALTAADVASQAATGTALADTQTGNLLTLLRGTGTSLITVNNLGFMTVTGYLTVASGSAAADTSLSNVNNDMYLSANTGKSIFLRPNGSGSTTGQWAITPTGTVFGGAQTIVNSALLGGQLTDTNNSGSRAGTAIQLIAQPTADSSAAYYGQITQAGTASSQAFNFTGVVAASSVSITHRGTGNIAKAYGYYTTAFGNTGAGTITDAHGFAVGGGAPAGTTNFYGLFIPTVSGATNNFGVYVQSNTSVLGGLTSIGGQATPTHSLTLPVSGTGLAAYNTSDQTTNYERVRTFWSSNAYTIATEAGGTGTPRNIILKATSSGASLTLDPAAGVTIQRDGSQTQIARVTSAQLTSTSAQYGLLVDPTINQSGAGAYSAIRVNVTETALGSGAKRLLDLAVGGTVMAYVDNTGILSLNNSTSRLQVNQAAGSGNSVFTASVAGDTNPRLTIYADGKHVLGSGSAAGDTVVSRPSTGGLSTTTTLTSASGTDIAFAISPTINQSGSAAYTALSVNVTETAAGSGNRRLLDLAVGGTTRFVVNSFGRASQFLVASTDIAHAIYVGSETGARYLNTGGVLSWGPGGSAGTDTYVLRSGVNALETGGAFNTLGQLTEASVRVQTAKEARPALATASAGATGGGYWVKLATYTHNTTNSDMCHSIHLQGSITATPYWADLRVLVRTGALKTDPTSQYLEVAASSGFVASNFKLVRSQVSNGTTPNIWELWVQTPTAWISVSPFEQARIISDPANMSITWAANGAAWQAAIGAGTQTAASYASAQTTQGGVERTSPIGTSGTQTCNLNYANRFYTSAVATGIITPSFTNVPASGNLVTVQIKFFQGGTAYTPALPTGGRWFGGTPAAVPSKDFLVTYQTQDGGSTWDCFWTVQT